MSLELGVAFRDHLLMPTHFTAEEVGAQTSS